MTESTTTDRVTVGVRELKNQLSAYLERVKAGEEITVTQHGRPIARLTTIGTDDDKYQTLIDAGVIVAAQRTRRRLPTRRVKLAPGEPLEVLVAKQRR
ncbi:MAG: type II toxin-antitoxin system Phd/YefM family antitoxin [Actinobacteria bacterium]|nr:type II toxin-antitoxin system Phd/YefM family antitoxin [Actinomycetota bacterium]